MISPAAAQDRLTVFAAASLTNALEAIGTAFEEETGMQVLFSFAGTSALARQIEAGAPADVFVSADEIWMDYLRERQAVVPESIKAIAGNGLVFVGPAGSEPLDLDVGGISDALGRGRLAIADTETVPAGRYGKAALTSLGLWAYVQKRLAPMENVRVALAAATRGDTPLALVYASDASVEPGVDVVAKLPAESHQAIRYPAALTQHAAEGADAFLAYLSSAAAQRIFEESGFAMLQDSQ
ncbi:molybdate ABC transporter substrate-binding protein [Roseibium hamelinense]|nr:molybdate ABC transporter substrate-binding protein [Roseibium hamelinense]